MRAELDMIKPQQILSPIDMRNAIVAFLRRFNATNEEPVSASEAIEWLADVIQTFEASSTRLLSVRQSYVGNRLHIVASEFKQETLCGHDASKWPSVSEPLSETLTSGRLCLSCKGTRDAIDLYERFGEEKPK